MGGVGVLCEQVNIENYLYRSFFKINLKMKTWSYYILFSTSFIWILEMKNLKIQNSKLILKINFIKSSKLILILIFRLLNNNWPQYTLTELH